MKRAARMAAAAILVTTVTAGAQPVTRPSDVPCSVRVVDAPDAVRAEIERWVRAEPRCQRELVVRVARVRRGFRLVATSADGRVRERVIPDAQSAAVLVVSWMADDSIDDALDDAQPAADAAAQPAADAAVKPTPVKVQPPPRRRITAPATDIDSESPLGPSIRVRAPARLQRHRWLSLGAALGDEAVGFHAQIDVLARGRFTFGVAGGWGDDEDGHRFEMRHGHDEAGSLTLFAAYTRSFGRVDVRAQVGVGAAIEAHEDWMGTSVIVEPALQAGAFARVRVGSQWGVLGGPLLLAPADHHPSLAAFVGIEHRL